jgi:hypothetical protein
MGLVSHSNTSYERWKNRIIGYEQISPRTVKLRLKLLTYTVTIVGIYTPIEGKTSNTEEFYDDQQ